MVNINGQYQMSPENSSKNGTFDIDWGTTDIDRRPFDNDKSISNVPRRNVWDKRKWPVDFKSPQYMCVGDKWYWPVNIKCPPWGSSLPSVSRTFDINQSISNVPHGGPASPVSQGYLILTSQCQLSPHRGPASPWWRAKWHWPVNAKCPPIGVQPPPGGGTNGIDRSMPNVPP